MGKKKGEQKTRTCLSFSAFVWSSVSILRQSRTLLISSLKFQAVLVLLSFTIVSFVVQLHRFAFPWMLPIFCGVPFCWVWFRLRHQLRTCVLELMPSYRECSSAKTKLPITPTTSVFKTEPSKCCVEYSCQTAEKRSHKHFLFSLHVFLDKTLVDIVADLRKSTSPKVAVSDWKLANFIYSHLWLCVYDLQK